MNRQDVKTIIDRLKKIEIYDLTGSCTVETVDSAIRMLEELANEVHDQQIDIQCLKQEILQLEAMIDD